MKKRRTSKPQGPAAPGVDKEALARMIKDLVPATGGTSFVVETERQRQSVCTIAKTLRDAGAIQFDVRTWRRPGGGYKVTAHTE